MPCNTHYANSKQTPVHTVQYKGYFRKTLILFYDLYLRILTKIPVR